MTKFQRACFIALIGLSLAGVPAWADLRPVVSPVDGNTPYWIEAFGDASHEAGIYVTQDSKDFEAIVAGKPLVTGLSNGIIAHLAIARFTRRYEAAAVVDGKLFLIRRPISSSDESSRRIDMGQEKAQVLDLFTRSPLSLPLVMNPEDISFFDTSEGITEAGVSTLIVSMRGKDPLNLSSLKEVTFALMLRTDGDIFEVIGEPLKLDDRFIEPQRLRELYADAKTGGQVYSPLLIQSFANDRRDPNEPNYIRKWRRILAQKAQQCVVGQAGWASASDCVNLPRINLRTGKVTVPALPTLRAAIGSRTFDQVYNPVTGRHQLRFANTNLEPVNAEVPLVGGVDGLPEEMFGFEGIAQDQRWSSWLTFFDGVATLISSGHSSVFTTRLGDFALEPELLNSDHISTVVMDRGSSVAVVQSFGPDVKNLGPGTWIYVLERNASGVSLRSKTKISNNFYVQSELRDRIGEKDTRYYFDHTTPSSAGGATSYQQRRTATTAKVDLFEMEGGTHRLYFGDAISTENLTRSLIYRKLDPTGLSEDPSRLEWRGIDGKNYSLSGELLFVSPEGNDKSWLLSGSDIKGKSDDQSFDCKVFAIDRSFQKGENGFVLFAAFSQKSADFQGDPVRNGVMLVELGAWDVPFKNLAGAQVIGPIQRPKNQDSISFKAVIGLAKGESSRQSEYGFKTASGKILRDKSGVISSEVERWSMLSPEVAVGRDFESRLFGDLKSDRLFFTLTPGLAPTEEGFEAIELWAMRKMTTNQLRGVQLESVTDLKLGDQSGQSGGWSDNSATWKTGKYQLRNVLKGDSKNFPEIAEKDVPKVFSAAPELNADLEAIANPANRARKVIYVTKTEEEKLDLLSKIAALYTRDNNDHWKFSSNAGGASIFYLDPNYLTHDDVVANLNAIRKPPKDEFPVFLGDVGSLVKTVIVPKEGAEVRLEFAPESDTEEEAPAPHILSILAADGSLDRVSELGQVSRVAANRMRGVMVATLEEVESVKTALEKYKQGQALSSFELDYTYYDHVWKIKSGESGAALKKQDKNQKQRSNARVDARSGAAGLFPGLVETLDKIANPKDDAEHVLLIVPEEAKKYVRELMISWWRDDASKTWSRKNASLSLYDLKVSGDRNIGSHISQKSMLSNLSTISAKSGTRSVLLSSLSDIAAWGRQLNSDNWSIADFANPDDIKTPHLLYLLESEGKKIPTEDFAKNEIKRKNGMILIGTQAEWDQILEATSFEQRFGLHERFRRVEIKSPSKEAKIALLESMMKDPTVASIGYRYRLMQRENGKKVEVANLSQEAIQESILKILISRVEMIADESGQDPLIAFLRASEELKRTLLEDPQMRSGKVIDGDFVARLVGKVFGQPLTMDVLPATDPFRRLADPRKAAIEMQNYGYDGPLELKYKVFETLLSQFRHDPTRIIPSSFVVFGSSSSGKTLLFKTLAKMLGLKAYDPNSENNQEAQIFIINMAELTSDAKDDKRDDAHGTMSADEAIARIEDFLCQPLAYRGMLVLDDAHKAPPKALQKVMAKVQSMLDAPNGLVTVKEYQSEETRQVPLRNLTIGITINPTTDQQKIQRFAKGGTDEEMIVASLSNSEFTFDVSMIKRLSFLLKLDNFPVEAKGPQLTKALVESARVDFNSRQQLVIVSQNAIRRTIKKFPQSNAREFLAQASGRLIATSYNDDVHGASLQIVVPKGAFDGYEAKAPGVHDAHGSDSPRIGHYINDNMTSLAVTAEGYEGRLQFVRFLAETYRLHVYETFLKAFGNDPRFLGDPLLGELVVAPILHAGVTHLAQDPEISLSVFPLNAGEFGVKTGPALDGFNRAILKVSEYRHGYFPFPFQDQLNQSGFYKELTDSKFTRYEEASRSSALFATYRDLKSVAENAMASLLRVDSIKALPGAQEWIEGLPVDDPRAAMNAVGNALIAEYIRFSRSMQSSGLVENQPGSQITPLSPYDQARLFLYALDRAITELPWAKISGFMQDGITLATQRTELGQSPEFQNYAFRSNLSLLKPGSAERVLQSVEGMEAFQKLKRETTAKLSDSFGSRCNELLVRTKK